MDRHSHDILELPAVLELLAREAASPPGRDAALRLTPSGDRAWIEATLDGTSEFSLVLSTGGFPSLAPARDLGPALEVARIPGAVLEAEALLGMAATLRVAMQARVFFRRNAGATPRLEAVAARLAPPGDLVAEVERCIEPAGTVADDASPALREVRRQIRSSREQVLARLQAMLHSPNLSGHIAEPLVTLRNDRYVIPVKAASRSAVPGLLHDQSASGLTLYVEPTGVVELNNALRQLHTRETAEVRNVFLALTAAVHREGKAIAQTVDALVELDLLAARARLANRLGASRPKIADDWRLILRAARHPLLAAQAEDAVPTPESAQGQLPAVTSSGRGTAVPIDVELGGAFHVLVITGPNTGGKTVALKTVGLLALMVRVGLHLPASADSQVPLYSGIFADIGDEQSIAQSLSTFSSHMSHIRDILGGADGHALVLLDELGAGTDPDEGAALGIAVLEALAARGTATVATTHLEAIKAFAASQEGVANSSVEFDLDTLRPLYRLRIGLPGKSFAVEIAARLGLPDPVIHRAQAILGEGRPHLRSYLERLQQAAEELDAARRAAVAEAELARGSRAEWERRARCVAEEAERYRQQAQHAIREILAEGRRRIGAAVGELRGRATRRTPEVVPSAAKAAQALVAGLPGLPAAPADALAPPVVAGLPPEDLSPGRRVMVPHLGQHGTILEPPSADGRVLVQLVVGRVWVAASALAAFPDESGRRAAQALPATLARPEAPATGPELNVLGCTAEEACGRVERYLDDAFLNGLTRVRIVHGKGTGTLRRAVADLLKAHPLVETFSLADQAEGGSGATVVTLQRRDSAA